MPDARLDERTARIRKVPEPVREFLRTETGGAVVLLAAAAGAILWVNLDRSSYDGVWSTQLGVRAGRSGISLDFRHWVNEGLMTLYFLVIGLEARREFDLGEFRDRRRGVLTAVAALGGMLVPIGIFLAINAGRPSEHGWGTVMSTDTAFALGVLALVGRGFPASLRTFLLTMAVVDDLVAFVVIATVFTHNLRLVPLLIGSGALILVLIARLRGVRNGGLYLTLGLAAWFGFLKAGVDPVVVGMLMGLTANAYPAVRADLEQVTDLFRRFREQPISEHARDVRRGVRTSLSPNERLQQLFHPFSSYLVAPLFALANAGVAIDAHLIPRAYGSPITLGIIAGYVIGKPVGITGSSWLSTRLSPGRVHPPVGWASVLGAGTVAGIGFTVSLLIATLAFHGVALQEAKLGLLSAAVCASALAWVVFRSTRLLPETVRLRAVLGTAQPLVDLAVPVDARRDHIRGPASATVTLLEYGDFDCPYCGQAEPVIRELLADFGDLRYVWRHLPLNDVHSYAQLAAEAAEAGGAQGKFWEMHDLLLEHQDALQVRDLVRYAEELELDVERFREALRKEKFAGRVAEDVDSADESGVSGTPTFFINGRRHYGAYDIATLSADVRAARARAMVAS